MEQINQPTKNSPKQRYYRKKNYASTVQTSTDTKPEEKVPTSLPSTIKRRKKKKKSSTNLVQSTENKISAEQPIPIDEAKIFNSKEIHPGGTTEVNIMKPALSKEQTTIERDVRRASKQKNQDVSRNLGESPNRPGVETPISSKPSAINQKVEGIASEYKTTTEKSREDILAEREAKKQAKLAAKNKPKGSVGVTANQKTVTVAKPTVTNVIASSTKPSTVVETVITETEGVTNKINNLNISASSKETDKPVLTKAERRAKQEAQRAAKAQTQLPKTSTLIGTTVTAVKIPTTTSLDNKLVKTVKKMSPVTVKSTLHRVKLFNHLYADRELPDNILNSANIHPSVIKLGAQYANRIVVGSNARCIAFMNTMKMVIQEYKTPLQKEFSRGLEATIKPCIDYLHQCRPLSVSITNALKFIKWQITQLPTDESDAELKAKLLESVDTYIRDQIEKAAQAISISVQQKISNGDVILTFGCSSLINHILNEAQKRTVDFRVIVVDARPDHEGQEMLRRLVAQGIRCTCVLINAVGFIMPEVTKVLLGAHALMANGYVMSRAGTAQVALVAKSYNVPVLVCCETHKFSERVQTDAFVYNEIGNPTDLVLKSNTTSTKQSNPLSNWESLTHLTPLNLCYDITPPELVTAVVTEVAILPCTSVPVILRIQPS